MKRLSILFFCTVYSALVTAEKSVVTPVAMPVVNNASNVVQMLLGLGVIIGFIFITVWLIKRVGVMNYHGVGLMKIKSCLPLSNKEKIFLIEAGDEQLLIGVAPGFVGLIKTLDKPIVAPLPETPVSSLFAEKLKSILSKGEVVE
jgi:flagellar protein FliO/FliZ